MVGGWGVISRLKPREGLLTQTLFLAEPEGGAVSQF